MSTRSRAARTQLRKGPARGCKGAIMSELKILSATIREAKGKNPNRRLRKEHFVPAVFYNAEGKNFALQVEMPALEKIYKSVGRTTVFNLEIDDNGSKSTYPCLFWQIQYHPVKGTFSHIDFYGVDLNKEVRIRVPLEFAGTAKGTKVGGKMEIYREHMYVMAKPLSLPSKIVVDVTELGIGAIFTVADLQAGDGVRVMAPENQAIASVILKGKEEATTEEAE